ncbi:MAG: hypothetical protein ACK5ML_09010 [Lachnospiraceae bacterium]
MEAIKIVLKVKSPSVSAEKFDFNDRMDEILEAVNVFNDQFRDWSKRIIVIQIAKRAMQLILSIEKEDISENVSVREIRSFIQHLRNNKNWKIYTKEQNKMFETVEFKKIDMESLPIYIEKIKVNNELYYMQKNDVDFLEHLVIRNETESNIDIEMEDVDMMTVLKYLIQTKNKGVRANEKERDIESLKSILKKWL